MGFFSKLVNLNKIATPYISGPVMIPNLRKTNIKKKKKNKIKLIYAESEEFYTKLDCALGDRRNIAISFNRNKLTENSKLFKYMSHCEGWEQVKDKMLHIAQDERNASVLMTQSCAVAITSGVIYTIIAALFILALIALCKDYSVKIKAKPKDLEYEIEFNKP